MSNLICYIFIYLQSYHLQFLGHFQQVLKLHQTGSISCTAQMLFQVDYFSDKFKFIKNNTRLLDLGSHPGGWSQVAAKLITKGKLGKVYHFSGNSPGGFHHWHRD